MFILDEGLVGAVFHLSKRSYHRSERLMESSSSMLVAHVRGLDKAAWEPLSTLFNVTLFSTDSPANPTSFRALRRIVMTTGIDGSARL